MLKKIIFPALSILIFSNYSFATLGYLPEGCDYGDEGAKAYVASPTTFDRQKFLDQCFLPFLSNSKGMTILDAGCGPAHWSIYAAEHGAKVYAIDINQQMIESAALEICKLGMLNKISLEIGDVGYLPYRDNMFNRAVSINVTPNLPSNCVRSHFIELHRVLAQNGQAIITVPVSLDIVFTNGLQDKTSVYNHINDVLKNLSKDPYPAEIFSALMELKEVINATFAIKDGYLTLITNKEELQIGQKIWRKLPVLVVPNYYHPENEYTDYLKKVGFEIEKIEHPHFHNYDEYTGYNALASNETHLGPEYLSHSAYAVYHIKKKNGKILGRTGLVNAKNSLRKSFLSMFSGLKHKKTNHEIKN